MPSKCLIKSKEGKRRKGSNENNFNSYYKGFLGESYLPKPMGFSDSVFENKLLAKKIGCFDPTQYKMANKFANTKQKPTIMKSGEFANKGTKIYVNMTVFN